MARSCGRQALGCACSSPCLQRHHSRRACRTSREARAQRPSDSRLSSWNLLFGGTTSGRQARWVGTPTSPHRGRPASNAPRASPAPGRGLRDGRNRPREIALRRRRATRGTQPWVARPTRLRRRPTRRSASSPRTGATTGRTTDGNHGPGTTPGLIPRHPVPSPSPTIGWTGHEGCGTGFGTSLVTGQEQGPCQHPRLLHSHKLMQ